jgi:UDP-N-acetylmuramoyl-L-alanyl-D-glutamate--2,6-diaminopimelate ligase
LDYHGSFKAYINAKKQLFDQLESGSFALINIDDKRAKVLVQNTSAKISTYALKAPADYKARILTDALEGLEMDIDGIYGWYPLIGEFNAYNILAVYAVASLLGEDKTEILRTLSSIEKVSGRFELVYPESGVVAIVDYAHTPNALENVLGTINGLRTGNEKVITVIGCGGDRDKEKRPMMAKIACQFSDKVILTSDNPRNEDPAEIIQEMQEGVAPQDFKKTITQIDRKEAIKTACSLADTRDMILVAGKGHETYQEIKGVKYDFDDRIVLKEMLEIMTK